MTASNYLENAWLNTLRGTSFSVANTYVKLHIGDPGEDCTGNPAGETTREEVTFAAASGGSMSSNNVVTWTNVSTTETYSHFSVWDASTAGNPLGYAALTASKSITAGDDATFPSGQLTWSVN